ncbi:transposase [Methylobacillus methanolivorans]
MVRLPRVCPVGIPQHIIQRGNNRQTCFASEDDFSAYLSWLKAYSKKFDVAVHAWVLMTNHVHLLCTPKAENGISQMMQSIGRQYVRYFNYTYKRSGTLWEGRYKSCLVEAERYLLALYRYIEINPVRANMVEDPASYPWSSYQINALGKVSSLCTPHDIYMRLGADQFERTQNYRGLFKSHVETQLLDDIRLAANTGMALGQDRFKQEVERLTGRRQRPQKRGRPIGWRREEC